MSSDGQVLAGGTLNRGSVVRVGETVRRPRGRGHLVVEALLLHLEDAGFEGAPRFLGTDDLGRQVLTFVPGEVLDTAPDIDDDEAVARHVGRIATLLRELHEATAGFEPPPGAEPARPLPVPGATWTHGDVVASNVVLRDGVPVAFVDWEFAGPADPVHDLAAVLGTTVRGPKRAVDDVARREDAVRLAMSALVDGYRLGTEQVRRLPLAVAAVLVDAADFWAGRAADVTWVEATRWRADWFRHHAERLTGQSV